MQNNWEKVQEINVNENYKLQLWANFVDDGEVYWCLCKDEFEIKIDIRSAQSILQMSDLSAWQLEEAKLMSIIPQ